MANCNMPFPNINTHNDKYVLLQNINWFGRNIPAGTIYHQVNADYYTPSVSGARCPSLQLDFYTVKNNPGYFLKIAE